MSQALPPLAFRVRPTTLDAFRGQEHLIGPGKPLRRAIEQDELRSVILAGPPGTGKTTLAKIIAERTKAQFRDINAVLSGVKELREICAEAEKFWTTFQQRTVLFIDEIHRFNTAQQDALLPYVESGVVILIGATTGNPYFDVNAPLVSRSQVCLLQPLTPDDLKQILLRAVQDEHGFGGKISIAEDALEEIAQRSNGDARIALNILEQRKLKLCSSSINFFNYRGNSFKPRHPRCAPPSFSGNNMILNLRTRIGLAKHFRNNNRLQHSKLANGLRKLLERLHIKLTPRLIGVRRNLINLNKKHRICWLLRNRNSLLFLHGLCLQI